MSVTLMSVTLTVQASSRHQRPLRAHTQSLTAGRRHAAAAVAAVAAVLCRNVPLL
jgi:hypothetical protein